MIYTSYDMMLNHDFRKHEAEVKFDNFQEGSKT